MSTCTLLLRLNGSLQSWGIGSKFNVRKTEREPSKSGVIGLVAAAMGIRRNDDESVKRLSDLRMGVRADKEGKLLRDFQTVRGKDASYVTTRYYLSDASFLVGLEGEETLLREIEESFSHPVFPLFLGRRSCPPVGRICLGLREMPLEDALFAEPMTEQKELVRFVFETQNGENGILRRDQPISFSPMHRKYTFRQIKETMVSQKTNVLQHDPMIELE